MPFDVEALAEKPIKVHLLNKDELIYEVEIRDHAPESTVDKLRVQLRRLMREIPSDEIATYDGDASIELDTISNKISELAALCAAKTPMLKTLNRIHALGNHLFHRLGRVHPVSESDLQKKADLEDKLDVVTGRVEKMFKFLRSSLEEDKATPELAHQESPGADGAGLDDGGEAKGVDTSPPKRIGLPTPTGAAPPAAIPVVTCDRFSGVHTLNLKFNGKGCVVEFIQRLEELCLSRNISDAKLFASAAELFTDEALYWFRGAKSGVSSWTQLKSLLLDEYLPLDYDYLLLKEIRCRTQGPDEGIVNYLSIMQNYFGRLRKPLSETEELNIVGYNIRPFYSTQLALQPVSSWSQLKARCRHLEHAQKRAEAFVEPTSQTTGLLAPDLSYKLTVSGAPKQSMVVDNKKKPEPFCVRCRVPGHYLRTCTAPRVATHTLLCFGCGELGVTLSNCPKCTSDNTPSTPPVSKNPSA